MRPDLTLVIPEWLGNGVDATVADGARSLARALGAHGAVEIAEETTAPSTPENGVIGLNAIGRLTRRALDELNARNPSRLFTIGGTCGSDLASIAYLNMRYRGDLAVIWLDAHADLNTPRSSPSGRFHGMVLRTLLGNGPEPLVTLIPRPLAPTQIVLAGVRELDRDEAMFISDTAISRLSPADLLVPDRVAGRVRALGFTKIHVHFDCDVLDPLEFPDSLVRTPGGISIDQAVETIQQLRAVADIVGFSVVEFRPRTADAAARAERLIERCGIEVGVPGLSGRPPASDRRPA